MAFSFSRNGRIYVKAQTTFAAAATLSGANCCRVSPGLKLSPSNPRTPRNDKTGTLSRTPGIGGQRSGTISIPMDVAANGTPGTAPDCDPFLQSLFGAAPTLSAGVSVTYALADATVPLTIGHYRTPSSVQQQLAWGVNIESGQFAFNDNAVARCTFSGKAGWVMDSLSFSTLDTNGKAGLSSFPAEPGSPVTNGNIVSGFMGSLTLDSQSVATLKSASLRFNRSIELEYSYGNYYPTSASPTVRDVQLSFQLWDDDSAFMTDLLQKGISDAVVGATLVQGNVAGNTWTWTLKGMQIQAPSLDDGSQRWVADFGTSSASASSTSALDELGLVIT